jgi:hypothetical protein
MLKRALLIALAAGSVLAVAAQPARARAAAPVSIAGPMAAACPTVAPVRAGLSWASAPAA